jgi:hypothetical protein
MTRMFRTSQRSRSVGARSATLNVTGPMPGIWCCGGIGLLSPGVPRPGLGVEGQREALALGILEIECRPAVALAISLTDTPASERCSCHHDTPAASATRKPVRLMLQVPRRSGSRCQSKKVTPLPGLPRLSA